MMIPVNILLVEDNPSDSMFIRRRLEAARCGKFEVTTVEWLSTALTLLRNRTFDVVLLDLTLPDSHGIDTVVAVKREAPSTPVVVLSAQEDLMVATRSLEAGADSFVVKRAELNSDELERVVLFGMERAKRDRTARELIHSSVRRLTLDYTPGSSAPPPVAGLMAEPVNRVDEVVGAVLAYLQRNHPAAIPSVEQMLSQMGYYVAMLELRSALKMDGARTQSSSLSSRAADILLSSEMDPTDRNPESVLNRIIGGDDA